MRSIIGFFHGHLNLWNTSLYLILFTVLFVLADEYIAKPYRVRRMKKRAEHDPEVREALRVAEEVHRLRRQGKLTG
jgi:hypothetical protein